MEIGDTFYVDLGKGPHLYIIISHPSNGIFFIVAMMTSNDGTEVDAWKDDSCILLPEDGHSSLHHRSSIAYNMIEELTVEGLEHLIMTKQAKQKDRFSDEVILRILQGAEKSRKIRNKYKNLMRDQGLFGDHPY